jgi:type I restriction enzyme S subunit
MAEWRQLGSFVRLRRGQSYQSALLDQPGPILLGLGTIERNGGFRGEKLRTYGGESPERIQVHGGAFYVSLKDMTHAADLLGAVARVPLEIGAARLTQDTIAIDLISEDIVPDYLYWALRTPAYRSYCRAHGTGTTNLDLAQADFLAYELRTPSLPEQRAIADVLGALDDKIAANTKLAATAWSLASAHFQNVMSGPTVRSTIGSILSLEYGKSLPALAREPGSAAVVGSGGVIGEHATALVDRSGVVVGRKGSAGSVYWVDGPHWPIDTAFYVKPKASLSQEFAYFLLGRLRLNEMNGDSAVPGLNRVEAESLVVDVPAENAIEAFTARTRPLIELARQLGEEAGALAALRDTLLPRLMDGSLQVRDLEKT